VKHFKSTKNGRSVNSTQDTDREQEPAPRGRRLKRNEQKDELERLWKLQESMKSEIVSSFSDFSRRMDPFGI